MNLMWNFCDKFNFLYYFIMSNYNDGLFVFCVILIYKFIMFLLDFKSLLDN